MTTGDLSADRRAAEYQAARAIVDLHGYEAVGLDAAVRAITRDLIDPADIIGPGEIRQLAGGVTRATMKNWREGRGTRGAGTFPQPFKTVSGVELYDRRAVLAWLEEHRP